MAALGVLWHNASEAVFDQGPMTGDGIDYGMAVDLEPAEPAHGFFLSLEAPNVIP